MQKPNILLITTDQQHFSTLGTVNDKIKTPNLDRLCLNGTRFDRAYCPSPVCTPSRASIATGLYPSEHGAWTIGVHLDENIPTLPQMLKQHHYRSALIGKGHFQPLADSPTATSVEKFPNIRDLDFWRKFNGPWYGFDHIELTRNHADEALAGQHYGVWLEDNGLDTWRTYFKPVAGESSPHAIRVATEGEYWKDDNRKWHLPADLHYTKWTADRSIAFIDDVTEQSDPFLLWASFHDPHPPYVVPEPWASMYDPDDVPVGELVAGEHDNNPPHFGKTQETDPVFEGWQEPHYAHGCHSHLIDKKDLQKDVAIYYGMVSFLDEQIGRILDHLEDKGILDNTLILFTTDHGHFIGQHGLIAKGPFHYEDLLRVPFIVSWPKHVPSNKTSNAIQSLIDITPTVLTVAGLPIPKNLQGVCQWGVWRGKRDKKRDYALCQNRHNPDMPHVVSYIEDQYKITVYKRGEHGELFDLKNDTGEINNLWHDADSQEIKMQMMHKMLQATMNCESTKMPRVAHA